MFFYTLFLFCSEMQRSASISGGVVFESCRRTDVFVPHGHPGNPRVHAQACKWVEGNYPNSWRIFKRLGMVSTVFDEEHNRVIYTISPDVLELVAGKCRDLSSIPLRMLIQEIISTAASILASCGTFYITAEKPNLSTTLGVGIASLLLNFYSTAAVYISHNTVGHSKNQILSDINAVFKVIDALIKKGKEIPAESLPVSSYTLSIYQPWVFKPAEENHLELFSFMVLNNLVSPREDGLFKVEVENTFALQNEFERKYDAWDRTHEFLRKIDILGTFIASAISITWVVVFLLNSQNSHGSTNLSQSVDALSIANYVFTAISTILKGANWYSKHLMSKYESKLNKLNAISRKFSDENQNNQELQGLTARSTARLQVMYTRTLEPTAEE